MTKSCIVTSLFALVLAACASTPTDETPSDGAAAMSQQPTLGEEPSGTPTQYPFILVSGVATSPTFHNFLGVPEAYRAVGHGGTAGQGRVAVADLPPFGTVEERGAALAEQIKGALDTFGARKINIVAHSMGGLDSRVAIRLLSDEGGAYAQRVASLTTIATPHHGAPLADVALGLTTHVSTAALDSLGQFLGRQFSDQAADSEVRGALFSISVANSTAFNAKYPALESDGVQYQSWAGVSRYFCSKPIASDDAACEGKHYGGKSVAGCTHLFLTAMADFMDDESNDALVPVSSAKFGGFQGCVPADHLDEIGAQDGPTTIGFDHVRFYKQLAFDLARSGY